GKGKRRKYWRNVEMFESSTPKNEISDMPTAEVFGVRHSFETFGGVLSADIWNFRSLYVKCRNFRTRNSAFRGFMLDGVQHCPYGLLPYIRALISTKMIREWKT
ncbi:hypothetical protein Tcan_00786, partial [Toxocara canis]